MFNKTQHSLLSKYSNNVSGVERAPSKELVTQRLGGLTIISGSSGSGKNTLMAGIALHCDPQDCLVVFTESRPEDNVLGKVANSFLHYTYGKTFNIDNLLSELDNSSCTSIFIEQYPPKSVYNAEQSIKGLDKLRHWCKENNKNIYICVHARKANLREEK